MANIIRVSAHQYKDKVAAKSKVDSILKHRRDRITTIREPLTEIKAEILTIEKRVETTKRKIKLLVDKGLTSEASIEQRNLYGIEKELSELLIERLPIVKNTVARWRSKYRISNKYAFGEYKCVGKCSKNSQWLFKLISW